MIAIYGATGVTGGLVVEALAAAGHPLRLVGRDGERLARAAAAVGADHAIAPVHDREALGDAFAGAAVVVSCAGPFLTIGEPVLLAAIDAGAHYLDTSGEQAYVRRAYEGCDALARRAGVVAVPACAFEVALGDWAAALAGAALPGDGPLDAIAIGYALEDFRPTPGTRASALASLSQPGVIWDEDRWLEIPPAAHGRSFAFPPPFGARETRSFPSSEVVTVPRHLATNRVETFASLGDTPAIRAGTALAALAAPLVPFLLGSPLGGLLRATVAAAPAPPPEARHRSRFAIVAEAERRFQRARVSVTGADPYAVTAAVIVEAVAALRAEAAPRPGVLAPAEAFPAARFLPRVAAARELVVGGDAAPGGV